MPTPPYAPPLPPKSPASGIKKTVSITSLDSGGSPGTPKHVRRHSRYKSEGVDFFMDIKDDHVNKMHLARMKEAVPYTDNLSLTAADEESLHQQATHEEGGKKCSIIGCGQVGLAIAYAMLNQETPSTIAMVDMAAKKLEGEAKDMRQGSAFHTRVKILASTDYDITEGSKLVIITAGCARKPGDSRLGLMKKNVNVMKMIIPQVLEYSPNAAICIISNPCDIMTAVAAKIAGPSIPAGRIFGSGTCLDSSRLRSLVAQALDIDTQSAHAYVVGEHGDSQVPVWSSVRVGGVPLLKYGEKPSELHHSIAHEVVTSGAEVINLKGYTNWAIGMSVAHIAKSVLEDVRNIIPLSTCVRGFHGVDNDVFISLPCVVGSHGIKSVVDLKMTTEEIEQFKKSADKVWENQKDIWDEV